MRTLLITDDHDSVLRTLEYVLTAHGYRVLLASSGKTAIEMCQSALVDAALVDLHMPGMDGFQTCAALAAQAREQGRTLPVWLMSAALTSAARIRAEEVGAVAFFSKPFDCEVFASDVEKFFATPPQPAQPLPSSFCQQPPRLGESDQTADE